MTLNCKGFRIGKLLSKEIKFDYYILYSTLHCILGSLTKYFYTFKKLGTLLPQRLENSDTGGLPL